jgi:D-arginine dehydrogenase
MLRKKLPASAGGGVSTTHDVIIIGGGMAGASVGFELAEERRVLLLEAEEQPGYHATGRSAAAYIPSYGFSDPALRGLTLASRVALESPDPAFHEGDFLKRRGLLTLAHDQNQASLRDTFAAQSAALPGMEWVEAEYLRDALPLLREEYTSGAILERDVFDIDVHGLHEAYLKGLKKRGGTCETNSPVRSISRVAEGWRVDTGDASYTTPVIVNAAGAWVDEAAALAGVAPIGIQPLRRTAILVETPVDSDAWPLVMESGAGFYFKPDAGLLLVSPADETPSPPCDAAPEELDVAYAAHYLEQTLDMQVRQVKHSWAGLRS